MRGAWEFPRIGFRPCGGSSIRPTSVRRRCFFEGATDGLLDAHRRALYPCLVSLELTERLPCSHEMSIQLLLLGVRERCADRGAQACRGRGKLQCGGRPSAGRGQTRAALECSRDPAPVAEAAENLQGLA